MFQNTTYRSNLVSFDEYYSKDSSEILMDFIKEELFEYENSGNDLTVKSLDIKKGIRFSISVLIMLLISIGYVNGISFVFCAIAELLNLVFFYKTVFKSGIESEIKNIAIKNPDIDIQSIVRETIANAKPVTISWSKLYVIANIAIIIIVCAGIIILDKPKILYSEYEDGYQVEGYIDGKVFNNKIVIPSEYKGKPVLAIKAGAFKNSTVKKVCLPETIERIGGEAFSNAYNLKEINIPKKVAEIRGHTFENCKSLKSIYIPEGVFRIGGHAFCGCEALSQVQLPDSVKEIGSSAFRDCYSLKSVRIPRNAYVKERAFKDSPTDIIRY